MQYGELYVRLLSVSSPDHKHGAVAIISSAQYLALRKSSTNISGIFVEIVLGKWGLELPSGEQSVVLNIYIRMCKRWPPLL